MTYDTWLQDDAAYERYYGLDYDEDDEYRRGLEEERRIDELRERQLKAKEKPQCCSTTASRWLEKRQLEDSRMQEVDQVSSEEARQYRIELALRDIENAATVAQFRPEVANRCIAEITHRVKQLRGDLQRSGS